MYVAYCVGLEDHKLYEIRGFDTGRIGWCRNYPMGFGPSKIISGGLITSFYPKGAKLTALEYVPIVF